MEWIWLGVIAALILVELVSMTFTSMWFILGAIVSFILVKLEKSYGIQVGVFLGIGFVCILFIRPLLIKKLIKFRNEKIGKIFNKYPFLNHFVDVDLSNDKKKESNNSKHKKKEDKK